MVREPARTSMKILILSSCAKNTGSYLRAVYLAESLRDHCDVELVAPLSRSIRLRLHVLLSIPRNLLRVIARDADFLVGIKAFPNVTIPLLVAKYLMGRKVAVDIDDADHEYVKGMQARILALIQRPAPRRFDLVTYHNELLRDFIGKEFRVGEDRLYRLEQGVDLERFSPRDGDVEKGSLFFTGFLDVCSSLGSLLRAVRIVQQRVDAPLTVAGGGILEPRFRRLARSLGVTVRFLGQQPIERVVEEMARAEICLVYYDETEANRYRCSMKLRESLAMAKKTVCNDIGEMKHFEKYTYQSSSGIEDFAGMILDTLERGDGRELEGALFIRRNFDWKRIGERFYRRIQRLCARAEGDSRR